MFAMLALTVALASTQPFAAECGNKPCQILRQDAKMTVYLLPVTAQYQTTFEQLSRDCAMLRNDGRLARMPSNWLSDYCHYRHAHPGQRVIPAFAGR